MDTLIKVILLAIAAISVGILIATYRIDRPKPKSKNTMPRNPLLPRY